MKLIEILSALQRSNLEAIDISPIGSKKRLFQARVIANPNKSNPINTKFILIECLATAKGFVADFKKLCKSYIDEIKSLQNFPQPNPPEWDDMWNVEDYGPNSKNFLIDTEMLKTIVDGKKLKPMQQESLIQLITVMGASSSIKGSELRTPSGSVPSSPRGSISASPVSSAPSSRDVSPTKTSREFESLRKPPTPLESALILLGKQPNAVICSLLETIFTLLVKKDKKIEESTFLHDDILSKYSKDLFLNCDMKILTDNKSDNMIVRFLPRNLDNVRKLNNFFEHASASIVDKASDLGSVKLEDNIAVSLPLSLLLCCFQQLDPSVRETIATCQRIVSETITAAKKKKSLENAAAKSPRPTIAASTAAPSSPSVPPAVPAAISTDPQEQARREEEKRKLKEEREQRQKEEEQRRQRDLARAARKEP